MNATMDAVAYRRDLAKSRIDRLPETAIDKVLDFISYQAYSLGFDVDENDDENVDIESIPAMMEIIDEGINTPLSECKPIPKEWYTYGTVQGYCKGREHVDALRIRA
jgi:hypothetical protein